MSLNSNKKMRQILRERHAIRKCDARDLDLVQTSDEKLAKSNLTGCRSPSLFPELPDILNESQPSYSGQLKEWANDIVLRIKTHPSYPTASTQDEEQRAGQNDCPRYAHSRKTRTLRPEARCDVRTHRSSLSKRCRGHEDLRHTVRAQNIHASVFICRNLGAGEDIYKLLVRMEDRVYFPIYAPRALTSYVREEREYRWFGDSHGLVLYCHQLHLRFWE